MFSKAALKIFSFIVFLLISHPPMAAADIYTWVDDQGVHHFSNQPPSDSSIDARLFVAAAPYVRPPDLSALVLAEPRDEPVVTDLTRQGEEAPSDLEPAPLPAATFRENAEPQVSEGPESHPFLSQPPSQAPHREVVVIKRYRQRAPSYSDHQRRLRHRFEGQRERGHRRKGSARITPHYGKPYGQPHVSESYAYPRRHAKPKVDSHVGNRRHRWLPMLIPPAERHQPRVKRHRPRHNRTVERR